MSVGMPGTGIGGLFYLISGLLMPVREIWRWSTGQGDAAQSRVALRQSAIVGGVLGGIWVTGWLLGLVLGPTATSVVSDAGAAPSPPSVIVGTATVLAGLITLGLVLAGVELARVVLERRSNHGRAERPVKVRSLRSAMLAALLLSWPSVAHASQQANGALARAEAAWADGDLETARREYEVVVARDAENSRAIFRLAQLSAAPAEALRLYRRYVELEPADPWGYMAVGDILGRLGRIREALTWYDRAAALAPLERDVNLGRARLLARAGRSEQSAREYEQWLAGQPRDVEAWRELGRERLRSGRPRAAGQALARAAALSPDPATARRLAGARAAAAPAVEPLLGGSRDSDGNHTAFLGLAATALAADGARLGLSLRRTTLGGGLATGSSHAARLTLAWRPRAALSVDGSLGLQTLASTATVRDLGAVPTAALRLRLRAPLQGPTAEVGMQHGPLVPSSVLVANRVTRGELSGKLDLPLGPIRVRGVGRTAAIHSVVDENRRTALSAGVAVPVAAGIELGGWYHSVQYANPSSAGYFAPRMAQGLEAGSYLELEFGKALFAIDAGVGVQRAAEHAQPAAAEPVVSSWPPRRGRSAASPSLAEGSPGPWRGAFRWYSLLEIALHPRTALRFELEAYDSQLATQAATSAGWRYGSVSVSMRWAI